MRLAPLTFVRPGELRKTEWSEINVQKAEWRIPAERMKMKTQHIVPLSGEAIVSKAEQIMSFPGRYATPCTLEASMNSVLQANVRVRRELQC